jgi:hypothetical protein
VGAVSRDADGGRAVIILGMIMVTNTNTVHYYRTTGAPHQED